MRTVEECFAKSEELSRFAAATSDPTAKAAALSMARTWREVGRMAEWQDAHPNSETYRIQRQ